MADYFSPTVIQPPIPIADMTLLERLVLSAIFDAEPDGDALYFHSSDGLSDMIWLSTAELQVAIKASAGTDSTASLYVTERMASAAAAGAEIEIDFTDTSWEPIFQDIVRRSSTLPHVVAVTSFTCSKMRPDGFGGMVVLITADAIAGKSTEEMLWELLDRAEHGPLAVAPGFGTHVLLRLREQDVRTEIAQILAADETLTSITEEAVSDADIRAGCLAVVGRTFLEHERGVAVFQAAREAIHEAERRQPAAA